MPARPAPLLAAPAERSRRGKRGHGAELVRPADLRGILRRCHNKLHGRGIDGAEDDLTMDMVRILLAKAADEQSGAHPPGFRCDREEYQSAGGRSAVAARVQALFAGVVAANGGIFSRRERITVGARAICDVTCELQRYRLLPEALEAADWDLLGAAYEQYTATALKRQQGQFFTNRLVIDLMVRILAPRPDQVVLDPAGGSAGFLTSVLRHQRAAIITGKGSALAKRRRLDLLRSNLFMVESSHALVKIAKTAMLLGSGAHAGMIQGDSLAPLAELAGRLPERARPGMVDLILTNPPFAGGGEGRISDPAILRAFSTAGRPAPAAHGARSGQEADGPGFPPEMLFFERCLQWIRPGGMIGIVMPKSFLDTQTYLPLRQLIMARYRLRGVVLCHPNTFQPHTGVRTCLVFVSAPGAGERSAAKRVANKREIAQPPIYLAISRRIGQDSEGRPIHCAHEDGSASTDIDHDLGEILDDWRTLQLGRDLSAGAWRFSIAPDALGPELNFNPQYHQPSANRLLRELEAIDQLPGWSITPLDQLRAGTLIFKGPRLQSERLIVEEPGPGIERYHTPSSILQEKTESAKLLDVARASPAQARIISAIRVQRGDILITRSGTVARVVLVAAKHHGAIVSDDMIRIRIADEELRAYVYAYLQTDFALGQMKRNEYGAVQQHLEPRHIAGIMIPIPEDMRLLKDVIVQVRSMVAAKDVLDRASAGAAQAARDLVAALVGGQ
jgi:type I restriction enzyme M protein